MEQHQSNALVNCYRIQPDEAISSYVLRRLSLSGRSISKNEIRHYVCCSRFNRSGVSWRLWPFSGEAAAELFSGTTVDDGCELTRSHTVVQAVRPFRGTFYARRLAAAEWGDGESPLVRILRYEAPGLLLRASHARFCPECFRSQVEENSGLSGPRTAGRTYQSRRPVQSDNRKPPYSDT